MIQQRANMDWMLKELADERAAASTRSWCSPRTACASPSYGGDPDAADRLAAACAGLQSLAAAVATEFPHSDGLMRLVVIEVDGGFFYLMAAGTGAYLAVLADETVDAGLMGAPHARPGRPDRRPPDQPAAPRRAEPDERTPTENAAGPIRRAATRNGCT